MRDRNFLHLPDPSVRFRRHVYNPVAPGFEETRHPVAHLFLEERENPEVGGRGEGLDHEGC